MAKKFFDIIPPQEVKTSPKKIEDKKKSKPKRPLLKRLFFGLVCLVFLGGAAFYFFSKVEIEIWPEIDILNLEATVTINSDAEQPDFEAKVIPGKIFSDEKSISQEFLATGKVLKEEKARGIIRVYNTYSTSSQGLLPNTRFVSTDGKLFRSVKWEVIPGQKYEKGKLVPGEIDIEIQAAEPGEDYNIAPSTFSIPGFKGTSKYTFFYGKSFSPMTGGLITEVSQVTKEDIEKAKNTLTEKFKKENKNFLKTTLATDFVLLDETISQEVVESNSSAEVGEESESFNLQVKVKSEGLGFRESEIENFAKKLISLDIAENKKIQEESLEINYISELTDEELGKMVLNLPSTTFQKKVVLGLEIKAKVYSDIDLQKLEKALLGKSLQEIKIFLENLEPITKIKIKAWPFLRKKIPEDLKRLEIKLNLYPVK